MVFRLGWLAADAPVRGRRADNAYITAVGQEAELLSVLAHGMLTPTGRALADAGNEMSLDEAASEVVDTACGKVVLEGDLTGVVPGPRAVAGRTYRPRR